MIELSGFDTRPLFPRLTTLILASTVGTYLLILSGVSNALAGTAGTCSSWPLCGGPVLGSPELALVLAHRITAASVGLVLLVTLVVALTGAGTRRATLALAAATVLFPFEVLVGARAALAGPTTAVATLHLVTAMIIFTALMAALIWQLEAETPDSSTADAGSVEPDEPPSGEVPRAPTPGPLGVIRAYVRLTKPYLWWLLSFVALASMGLAAGGVPPIEVTVATIAGGVLAIGASGTFNNVLERDRDERMARTNDRPVVTAIVPPRRALAFGVVLAAASMAVFLAFVNVLAAGLGLLAIVFYSVVYTLFLKPNTDQNTVIGGAVGALPALIGWAAVTESIGLPAVVLGGVVFLWTPAHFYNLALIYKDDYARAGFPMLPVVRGDATTRRHIAGFLGGTLLATVLLGTAPSLGTLFAGVAVIFGAIFLAAVVGLSRLRTDGAAKRTFAASNAYLGAILLAVMVDTMVV